MSSSTSPSPAAFARLPEPPYYAVIFSAQRSPGDLGYAQMADHMVATAAAQPGFLGIESARDAEGFGITVSYWASEQAIAQWKAHAQHQVAQAQGRATWYLDYELRVARVERAYNKHSSPHATGLTTQPAP